MKRTSFALGAAVGLFCLSGPLYAQNTLDNPVGEDQPYSLDSGFLSNPTDLHQIVFTDFVQIEDSAWLRLYFQDTTLAPGSFVRITSALDGEVQELDVSDLVVWSQSSAYFNGDTVFVDLVAAPGSEGNRLSLSHVALEMPMQHTEEYCGICGSDDRILSYEDYAGRQMPVGCTASIWNEDSCMVSAGHCAGGGQVIEFNVPMSNSNCTLNHPPVEDQFPVLDYDYLNAGVGADWEVMTTGTNNLGETAYEHQGDLRRISDTAASVNDPMEVWGYAIDDECIKTQVQQRSPDGWITYRSSTHYEFFCDITFGNSGSSMIWMDTNEIIGIVTHCSYGCPNYGTRVDRSDFRDARESMCPGEFTVYDPVPGLAGEYNTVTVTGATPGLEVWFVWGLQSGSTPVPGCSGLYVDINSAHIAGSDIADGGGTANINNYVSNAAHGKTVLIQAVETDTSCQVSNLVSYSFP